MGGFPIAPPTPAMISNGGGGGGGCTGAGGLGGAVGLPWLVHQTAIPRGSSGPVPLTLSSILGSNGSF